MVDWRVPADEWDKFCEYVKEKNNGHDGYLGREAEKAMREYADIDGYGDIEDSLNRLVQATGRTPSDPYKEKNSSNLHQQSTTRVTVRVAEQIKNKFKSVVEESDDTYGLAFARAIQVRRSGGRADRLKQKLDRVAEDAEPILTKINEDSESDKLGIVDRNTIAICRKLVPNEGVQFTDDDLNTEIHSVAGRGSRASDPTLKRYRELVPDRLGYEPHPGVESNPTADQTVWVPEHVAEELAPEGVPAEARRPVEQLDRDDRIRRIQLVVGRRAANQSSGKVSVPAPEINEDILNDAVSRSTTLSLMKNTTLSTPGIQIHQGRKSTSLRLDLEDLGEANEELFKDIMAYRNADLSSLPDETTEKTGPDCGEKSSPGSKLDTLAAAGEDAATDGGDPS
jgi:hypothetical protein